MKEEMRLINQDETETKLGIWLYNRGFIGIIRLAFEFSFGNTEKVYKRLYKEIFAILGVNE